MRTLVERASRWLVNNRRPPLDSQGTVDYFRAPVQQLMAELPALLTGRELRAYEARRKRAGRPGRARGPRLPRGGAATRRTSCSASSRSPTATTLDPLEVARLHFALGERLGLPDLVTRILALPRDDRWQTMARAALRDDVYAVHAQLTAQVLPRHRSDAQPVPARIADWEDGDAVVVARAAATLSEICADDNADLARMSVGLRVVRGAASAN